MKGTLSAKFAYFVPSTAELSHSFHREVVTAQSRRNDYSCRASCKVSVSSALPHRFGSTSPTGVSGHACGRHTLSSSPTTENQRMDSPSQGSPPSVGACQNPRAARSPQTPRSSVSTRNTLIRSDRTWSTGSSAGPVLGRITRPASKSGARRARHSEQRSSEARCRMGGRAMIVPTATVIPGQKSAWREARSDFLEARLSGTMPRIRSGLRRS